MIKKPKPKKAHTHTLKKLKNQPVIERKNTAHEASDPFFLLHEHPPKIYVNMPIVFKLQH